MHIIVVGLNHQTAPVEIREKLSFSNTSLPHALVDLKDRKSILECLILSTCNRTEIYAVVDKLQRTKHYILGFLEDRFGISRTHLQEYIYSYEDDEAVRHLFRVTAGLDSMIIGETQILGQVKTAFQQAQFNKATGTWFNKLFKEAVTFSKRAHEETAIAEHPVSVSYAAIELGKQVFGTYKDKSVLVIGAGKMSELALKYLVDQDIKELFVVNRTYKQAIRLAEQYNGIPYPYTQMEEIIGRVDMVITSTSATEYVLTAEMFEKIAPLRANQPLFILDIAVPRDVDPQIGQISNVLLYDIDDLQLLLDAHLDKRKAEAHKIEAMIEQEVKVYYDWLATLGVIPLIQALQNKTKQIYEETITNLYQKLPELDERERKVIEKLSKSMLNQMLRDPILRIKELAVEKNRDEAMELFVRMFGLEEQLQGEQVQEHKTVHELRNVT